jgi:hypothetical protein
MRVLHRTTFAKRGICISWLAAFEYELSKNDVKRPTSINFVFIDKGYNTYSSYFNPRPTKNICKHV